MSNLASMVHESRIALMEKSFKVYVHPRIPTDKAVNAINSFAEEVRPEDILVLLDETLWGSAKNGLILTSNALYVKVIMEQPKSVILSEISLISAVGKKIYVDGSELADLSFAESHTVKKLCEILAGHTKKSSGSMSVGADFKLKGEGLHEDLISPVGLVVNDKLSKADGEGIEINFPKNTKERSVFFQVRKDFSDVLRGKGADIDVHAMSLAIYDCALAISEELKDSKYDSEEVSSVVNDDDIIYFAFVFVLSNVFQLACESYKDKDKVIEIYILPFMIVLGCAYDREKHGSNLTLSEAVRPISSVLNGARSRELIDGISAYGLVSNGRSGGYDKMVELFQVNCLAKLKEKYGENFVRLRAKCTRDGRDISEYLGFYAGSVRERVERILVSFHLKVIRG